MNLLSLEKSVQQFVDEKKGYYQQWLFDEPLVIGKQHNDQIKKLQKVMYKMIVHFVVNYEDFKDLMPLSKSVEELLKMLKGQPYNVGTYRTDFVYNEFNHVKLIEITCRFALNGMFLAAILNQNAEDFRVKNMPTLQTENNYKAIFKHFEAYYKDSKSIIILKGADNRNESKLFVEIFERTGIEIKDIYVQDIEAHLDELKSSWIISELSFDEILSIPKVVFKELSQMNVINDFRTIFLIHDKRFFSVIGNKNFQKSILTKEEMRFFERFYVPTYIPTERLDLWQSAKYNKSEWIIKHRALGKSQKIYAGLVTEQANWLELFSSEDFNDFVLQKWVDQQTICGSVNGDPVDDYVTGTLLFFDDHYYGFGDFRTSSFPVINKGDHRKISSLILSEKNVSLEELNVVNYIS